MKGDNTDIETSNDTTSVLSASAYMASTTSHIPTSSWILDSSATAHIGKDQSVFKSCMPERAIVGGINIDGPQLAVEGRGDVDLVVTVTGWEDHIITLKNVQHCPCTWDNLISESRMVINGLEINKKDRKAKITNPRLRGEIVMEGKLLHHKLYQMHCIVVLRNSPPAILAFTARTSKTPNNLKMWHCCLGHINYKYLQQLHKYDMVTGLDLHSNMDNVALCEGCALGKHPWVPFPSTNIIWARYPIE